MSTLNNLFAERQSAGHVEFFAEVLECLKSKGAGDIRVFGGSGGTITQTDAEAMYGAGVDRLLRRDTANPMKLPRVLSRIGPGLITGAADDDPSGVATYSQGGAQLGLHSMWTVLFAWPLVVAVQATCARLALITGKGLAGALGELLPRPILLALVVMLLLANTLNIAADLAAIGDAVQLLIGGPQHLYSLGFGVLSVLLQVLIPYERYVGALKWLTLSLFAYVGVVLAIPVPWPTVIKDTLLPTISLSPAYVATVVAIFGTTISPYRFFWQASQEVEERRNTVGAMNAFLVITDIAARIGRMKGGVIK